MKKKRFAGHTIAGYACNIGFAPDGKYISSGTGAGDVVFWDWKTGKIVKRLRCHDQVVIDHAWLPNEPVSDHTCRRGYAGEMQILMSSPSWSQRAGTV